VSAQAGWADFTEHLIPAYLDRLVPKLAGPIEVPWADRKSHITLPSKR
jgi:hypothetical protein